MEAKHDRMTPEMKTAVREFIELYGDDWQAEMTRFHMGRPSQKGMHLMSFIRQIRNNVSANPADLAQYAEWWPTI